MLSPPILPAVRIMLTSANALIGGRYDRCAGRSWDVRSAPPYGPVTSGAVRASGGRVVDRSGHHLAGQAVNIRRWSRRTPPDLGRRRGVACLQRAAPRHVQGAAESPDRLPWFGIRPGLNATLPAATPAYGSSTSRHRHPPWVRGSPRPTAAAGSTATPMGSQSQPAWPVVRVAEVPSACPTRTSPRRTPRPA